jgi:hypothetical protein
MTITVIKAIVINMNTIGLLLLIIEVFSIIINSNKIKITLPEYNNSSHSHHITM